MAGNYVLNDLEFTACSLYSIAAHLQQMNGGHRRSQGGGGGGGGGPGPPQSKYH